MTTPIVRLGSHGSRAACCWVVKVPTVLFITNARPTHHRHKTANVPQCSLIGRSRGAPTHSRPPRLRARAIASNDLINIVAAKGDVSRPPKPVNFNRIDRGVKLTPYSERFWQ